MDCRLIYGVTLVIGFLTLAVNGFRISSSATVGSLTTAITRDTCGQTKVCLETPASCDPNSNDTCLFVSAAAAATSHDEAVNFELRGDSESYVVLVLSPDMMQGNDKAFVCANYNGTNMFFTATFDNGSLTVTNKTRVRNVLAASKTNVVRCTFTIQSSSRKARYINEPFIFAGNGSITNGVLGDPVIMLTSNSSVTLSNTGSDMTFTDIPVGDLTVTITREGCGSTKYCEEVPADCDPSGAGECLFISARTPTTKTSGTKVNFEMRGISTGYIAMILSTDSTAGGNDTTFVCVYRNNNIEFLTAVLDNGTLTRTNESEKISKVMASHTENVIRCTFSAQGLNSSTSTTKASNDTSFTVFAAKGNLDVDGMLGLPNILLSSNGTVNLADFTSNGGAGLHPASLALLVLLSLLISRLV